MKPLTIEELINAGAHFGHPTHRWNPNYKDFILTKKNGIHIIDIDCTISHLTKAMLELLKIVKLYQAKSIFVGYL